MSLKAQRAAKKQTAHSAPYSGGKLEFILLQRWLANYQLRDGDRAAEEQLASDTRRILHRHKLLTEQRKADLP